MGLKIKLPKKLKFSFNKRHKIIVASAILSLGLLSTEAVPFYLTQRFLVGLAVLAYLLSLWALWEGLNKLKAIILMILPTLFTLAVASYYFLLPIRWLTRIPVAVFFGGVFYTLLLSQNIFNVASIRTIPLYRVASTTVFILTLFTAFLLFNVVFSFDLLFVWNGLIIFLLSLPLILQVIWSIEMERVSAAIVTYSTILALVMGELALALSFWPISNAMASSLLMTAMYVMLGITMDSLRERLSRGVVLEYLGLSSLAFLISLLTTSWTG